MYQHFFFFFQYSDTPALKYTTGEMAWAGAWEKGKWWVMMYWWAIYKEAGERMRKRWRTIRDKSKENNGEKSEVSKNKIGMEENTKVREGKCDKENKEKEIRARWREKEKWKINKRGKKRRVKRENGEKERKSRERSRERRGKEGEGRERDQRRGERDQSVVR